MTDERRGNTDVRDETNLNQPTKRPIHRSSQESRETRPVVVGVGASAGGLEAISRLLKGLPDQSGMSFVIVQHLDPTHKSSLVEILSRRTSLAIEQVERDTEVEPNHIYVIPPGQYLSIEGCVLKLSEPQDPRGSRMAIDYFLTSLAEDACEFGIGVVLSGTGSDGTAGLQEIKHYGGLTVVQIPDEAEHTGMPQSAMDAVHVDYVLPAEEIGTQLKRYVDFCQAHGPLSAQSVAQAEQSDLSPILDLLRDHIKCDFRRYRPNTLMRRIKRRMGLHQLDQLSDYHALLADNEKERESLRCDLLIGVTRFFRNPDAWQVLEDKVVRPMLEEQRKGPLRIWCAGCATGEEAYSIAMLLLEQVGADRRRLPFQIFATDVADDALAFARTGLYPEAIMKDVPLERLRRFFKKEPAGYRVSKQLRESVVFAKQNVLAQPPFAKLDLILCRNLLIYLQREAQERVMNVFQFALKEGGVLFQGSSETVGKLSDLFVPVSKKHRIYRRNALKAWPPARGDYAASVRPLLEFTARERKVQRDQHHSDGIATAVHRQLLRQLSHGVIVVNRDNRVLYSEGDADSYVQLGTGELSPELPDVMEVARKGLKAKLRSSLRKIWEGQLSLKVQARVHRDGIFHPCELQISKLSGRPQDDPAAMVVFAPLAKTQPHAPLSTSSESDSTNPPSVDAQNSIAAEQTLMEVEQELLITREQLNSSIADLESANEDLKAANEEAMTMNEELQSSNEELETSKEELQSLNEELTTLNSQLEIKVDELEETTNDLENLLVSSDVPTVFLDTQFRIRRYTPTCSELFHFIAGDVGRPLDDIRAYFNDPELLEDAKAVLGDLQPREKRVVSTDGQRRYRRRLLPYRTNDNHIQGVVLTLTDVTDLLTAQEELQRQLAENQVIYATSPVGLAYVDTELTYLSINERLAEINGPTVEEHLGKKITDILPPELADQVTVYYQRVLETGEGIFDLEVVGKTAATDEAHVFLVSYVPVLKDDGGMLGVNTVVQDITARKRREANLTFLADLQTVYNPPQSVDRLLRLTCQRTAEHLQLSHCCFVEVDAEATVADVLFDHVTGDGASLVGRHTVDDYHTPDEQQALLSGEAVTINDTQRDIDDAQRRANFAALGIGSVCNVAFVSDGQIKFIVGGTKNHPHPWRADEVRLLQDVTQRLCVRVERARAEQELADAKTRLDLSLEVASVAPWSWNMKTNEVVPSPTLNRVFGFDEDEVPKVADFIARIDVDAREQASAALKHSISTGEIYDQEYPVRLPDGEVRHVRARGAVRKSDDGTVQDFFGVVVDITERKRQEIELADREAHLRRVINNQLGLVGVIDRNGILVEVDDRSLSIAQVGREDVIGKHFAEAPWWSYDEKVAQQMREAMQRAFEGEVVRYDVSLFAHGEEGLMIDFMLAPVLNKAGDVQYLIPSGVDISDRIRAEATIRDNEQRLKMALKAGRMAAWEWTPEESVWTDDLYELLGASRDEVACPETFFRYVHPDDVGGIQQAWAGVTAGEDLYDHEFRVVRPDGEVRWLVGLGDVVRDNSGEVQRVFGLNWDITEQKIAEMEIRLSEERMRVAAGAAGFGVFHVDLDSNQVYWSDELKKLVGVRLDNEVNVPVGTVPDFVHPDDREKVQRHIDLILSDLTEPDHSLVHRVVNNDDEIRYVRMQTRALYKVEGETKRIKLIVGTLLDVTEQRDSERKLEMAKRQAEAASESKSAFLANMSHEIRTPMTAILGYADLLAPRIGDDEALGYLQTIRRNGGFLLDIINDILDLSKIEAGRMDVVHERFSAVRLIEEVRSIMDVRASDKGLTLEVRYQSKLPATIESDPKRLRQILINLVGNAIKFTKVGGVTIEVRYADDQLQLRVIDTGIGMSEQHKQRLFQPFSQADHTVTREFGGTGLGLAISRRLAALLGGSVCVESEPGQGSTFTVSIPVGNNETDLITPESTLELAPAPAPDEVVQLHCHVLVVDDRHDVRFLSRRFLSDAGARVSEAEDGELAIAAVAQSLAQGDGFDLVLLDMQMPKLDGYQAAKSLRELGYAGPIIALTADAMQGDMTRCIEAGCNDYLSKPIDKQVLLAKVKHYVEGSA